MKKVFLLISLLFFSTNAFAFNLGDALKDPNKAIDKNVVKKLEDKLDGEIAEYKKKIDAEQKKIENIIKETEDSINRIKDIKAKANSYIRIVKIILAVFASGILVLLFVVWRIYRNVVNLKKAIRNVVNYDDINARLKKVEAELAKR